MSSAESFDQLIEPHRRELHAQGVPDPNEMPPKDAVGMSAFALADDIVYHTYSAYARGMDALWGMYQWLDRAPMGRNDGGSRWFRLHDEYG